MVKKDLELIRALTEGVVNGEFETVAARAQEAVDVHPDEAQLWHFLGLAQDALKQPEAARESLQKAVALAPDNPAYVLLLSQVENRLGDVDIAKAHLETAKSIDPNLLESHLGLASITLSLGQFAEAEQHIHAAKRLNALHPMVLLAEGNLAFAKREWDKAAALLNQAAKAAPQSPAVFTSLGVVFDAQGHHAFAAQCFRRALELKPDAHSVRWSLSQSLLHQFMADESLEAVAPLEAEQPGAVAWRRAQVAMMKQDTDTALDALHAVVEHAADKERVVPAGVQLWLSAKLAPLARQWLVSLCEAHPALDAPQQSRIGMAASPSEEVVLAEAWLDMRTDHIPAQVALAMACERAGDLSRAETLARTVLEAQPEHPTATAIVGRYELREAPVEALARAERLLESQPEQAKRQGALSVKGMALDGLQRYEDAWKAFVEAQQHANERPPAVFDMPDLPPVADDQQVDVSGAVLLYGLPGSRVSLVGDALAGLPGRHVLVDRFRVQQRVDGFGLALPNAAPDPNLPPIGSSKRWLACIEALGAKPDDVIDWLPANPALIRRLPGAKLVAVVSDPRQLLLNWLAFGSPQHASAGDLDAAVAFLNAQMDQLEALQADSSIDTLMINAKALEEDTESTLREVMDFCGLSGDVPHARYRANLHGLGGLPSGFEAGHFMHYADAAKEVFATLKHVA